MADRLSMDSSAALAAGMTYGKYMAMMQGKRRPEPEPEPMKGETECPVCGKLFFKRTHNQKYCCERCKYKNAQVRRKERMQNGKDM